MKFDSRKRYAVSKRDKLIERLLERPIDFEYNEVRTLLRRLGYREDNRGCTSGSRAAFLTVKQSI